MTPRSQMSSSCRSVLPVEAGIDRRPDLLRGVVESQAAGEQPVGVGHLYDILLSQPERGHGPGQGLGPVLQVVLGVTHDGGLSGGSRGGVIAQQVPAVPHHQLVWIAVAQVLLGHEGKLPDVPQGPEVIRGHPGRPHALPIEGRALPHPPGLDLQKLQLEGVQLGLGQFLDMGVPNVQVPSSGAICRRHPARSGVYGDNTHHIYALQGLLRPQKTRSNSRIRGAWTEEPSSPLGSRHSQVTQSRLVNIPPSRST